MAMQLTFGEKQKGKEENGGIPVPGTVIPEPYHIHLSYELVLEENSFYFFFLITRVRSWSITTKVVYYS